MPTDANGVYSLPDGYLAVTGATIQASQHNPALEDIAAALTARLPRAGTAPMTGPLRVQDGNSSEPSIAFASDPSAGFYLSAGKIVPTKPLAGVFPIGLGPLPWSRTTVPAGWVLCYGQTLSRVTYADLWVVAQAEIAAGNPMYNNGDGALTFGILDMRGRVAAGYDVMGGVAATRLTGVIGVGIGAQNYSIAQNQLPNVNLPLVGTSGGSYPLDPLGGINLVYVNGAGPIGNLGGGFTPAFVTPASMSVTIPNPTGNTRLNGNVTQQVTSIVQPTIPMNAILYAGG